MFLQSRKQKAYCNLTVRGCRLSVASFFLSGVSRVSNEKRILHNLNTFIYAYTVAREQVGLPARPVLNADGQLIQDKPEPLEKPLTPQIKAMENHFLERYFELDELFWQGMDAIAASDQGSGIFRQRVFILKRFYGLNCTQISKQVGKWGKVITKEVEVAQTAFCQSLGILG